MKAAFSGWVGRAVLTSMAATVGVLVLAVLLAIHFARERERQWTFFAEAHDCKVVGKMAGDVTTGVGLTASPAGQVGTVSTVDVTPGKTGYACNDGVTYWR
jgi:hypothetical protein